MQQKLIVFSHLRWDFVYQRPQHLLSRLAQRYAVYFFEEPVRSAGPSRLELINPAPNVTVCRPHTAERAVGFHDDQLPELKLLLDELAEERNLSGGVVWFYSPMALPLAQQLAPAIIVYDCMDELSAFLNAPQAVAATRERLAEGGRSRVHRRAKLVSRQARTASGCPLLAEQRRPRALCTGARCRHRPRGPTRPTAPPPRLLRRHRRAHRRGSSDGARRRSSGLAVPDRRARRQDRSGLIAAAAQRSLSRSARLRGAAEIRRRLGRMSAPIRAEPCHALHQPNEDARIHGRRKADREHTDHRRRRTLRRHCADGGQVAIQDRVRASALDAGAGVARAPRRNAGDRRPHVMGSHGRSHGRVTR